MVVSCVFVALEKANVVAVVSFERQLFAEGVEDAAPSDTCVEEGRERVVGYVGEEVPLEVLGLEKRI